MTRSCRCCASRLTAPQREHSVTDQGAAGESEAPGDRSFSDSFLNGDSQVRRQHGKMTTMRRSRWTLTARIAHANSDRTKRKIAPSQEWITWHGFVTCKHHSTVFALTGSGVRRTLAARATGLSLERRMMRTTVWHSLLICPDASGCRWAEEARASQGRLTSRCCTQKHQIFGCQRAPREENEGCELPGSFQGNTGASASGEL